MSRQKGITQILKEKDFTISAEVFPPRNGRSPDIIFRKVEQLSTLKMDFVSITKGAMGSLRGGTVPIGYMISDRYDMDALVHFRCRDLDRAEVENLLVDHMYFGTRNILAVLGDPLPGEGGKQLDPSTHNIYACQLVRQIADMNKGIYQPLRNNTEPREGMPANFCIGVACYPEAEDMEKEMFVMQEKARAGADFAITQMIFSAEVYADYVKLLRQNGISIPVIPGIRPVTKMNHVIAAEELFGANVPDTLKHDLQSTREGDRGRVCVHFTIQLINELKKAGAPGVHLFTMNDISIIEEIVAGL